MAVAFDAVGPSATGTTSATSPLTWTHVCGAGATHLLVGATWDGSADGGGSMSATYNSVAMTSLGVWHTGGGTAGFLQVWALASPAIGSHSVAITFAGAPSGVNAGSVSFTGSSTLSAVQSAVSAGATANPSLTFTGSTTGNMVAAFSGSGTTVTQAGSFTQRYNTTSGSGAAGAGFTAGATLPGTGGSVTANWTMTADFWAVAAVEVRGAVPAGFIPVPLPQLPPGWFPGGDAVTTHPGGIPFAPVPTPADATPAVIIPPFPDLAPSPPPLLPPGWFPGADRVTAVPGGIPFTPEPGTTDAAPAVIFPVPEVAGIVQWLPWPPGYFPGSQAVSVDPGGIPFYSQPQPLTPPPAPAPVPVISSLAGGGTGYFTDSAGVPRLAWGDAVWALPGNAGRWNSGNWKADFDGCCANRSAQGFNILYAKPIGTLQSGNIDNNGSTFDSLYPFQGGTPSTGVAGANPSTGLTAAFWARIDYFLNAAYVRGITVFLNAIGYDSDFSAGPGPLFGKSTAEFQAYGAALGARYLGAPNLVWLLADDYFGENDALITAFMTGVRGAGDTHLVSIENNPETTSRFDMSTSSVMAWGTSNAAFNWAYSYNCEYFCIEYAYAEASPIPVLYGDGYFYQGTSTYTASPGYDRGERQGSWWVLASGARGRIHGSESIWQWQSTALASSGTDWYYANQAGPIRTFVEGLANWQNLLPAPGTALVTAGRGTRATGFTSGGSGGVYEPAFTNSYVAASVTPAGDLALLYLPNATTITVDQSKLGQGYSAYWVDPVTCVKTLTTSGPTYNSTAQGNNSQGDPDWVLLLQGPPVVAGSTGAPVIPLAPGWFPGADRVTAAPGGIPFLVQPEPDPGAAQATGTTVATATLTGAGAVAALVAEAPVATVTGAAAVSAVVTEIAGTSLAGAGAVSALVTEIAGATVAGAGGVSDVVTQAAAATVAGAGSITDVVTQIVTAALAGAATLTASAVGGSASANLAAAAALTALAVQAATAAVAGAGTVTATVTQAAKATAAGAGALSASGQITGTANLTGAGAVTALTVQAATAAPAAAASVSALAVQPVTAALAGAGTVTAAAATQAAFTVGTLTATDATGPGGTSALTASTAPSSTITASDQRTGGPG